MFRIPVAKNPDNLHIASDCHKCFSTMITDNLHITIFLNSRCQGSQTICVWQLIVVICQDRSNVAYRYRLDPRTCRATPKRTTATAVPTIRTHPHATADTKRATASTTAIVLPTDSNSPHSHDLSTTTPHQHRQLYNPTIYDIHTTCSNQRNYNTTTTINSPNYTNHTTMATDLNYTTSTNYRANTGSKQQQQLATSGPMQ